MRFVIWFVKLSYDQSYFYKSLELEKEIHHHIHLFFSCCCIQLFYLRMSDFTV